MKNYEDPTGRKTKYFILIHVQNIVTDIWWFSNLFINEFLVKNSENPNCENGPGKSQLWSWKAMVVFHIQDLVGTLNGGPGYYLSKHDNCVEVIILYC